MIAKDYHDADLVAFLKSDMRRPNIIAIEKDKIRQSDEKAKMLADKMKNGPVYRKEIEERLEAFHKQQIEKRVIRVQQQKIDHTKEATNVVQLRKGGK